jgi:hypothetical protein
MYYELLEAANTDFVSAIDRTWPRYRTTRLDAVVGALTVAQGARTAVTLRLLLDALTTWRRLDPNEFNNRGGSNGVGYRLWKEAKQGLRNAFNQVYPMPDPAVPPNCPGVTINGIYIPQGSHMEICHGFAFRWGVAAGKLAPNPGMTGAFAAHNGVNMLPLLYPGGGAAFPAARAGGILQIHRGDIVGMFLGALLGHSLIAESANGWFSANNTGSFGRGVGRCQVNVNDNFGMYGGLQCGWVGNGNQWRRPDNQVVSVIYNRIP